MVNNVSETLLFSIPQFFRAAPILLALIFAKSTCSLTFIFANINCSLTFIFARSSCSLFLISNCIRLRSSSLGNRKFVIYTRVSVRELYAKTGVSVQLGLLCVQTALNITISLLNNIHGMYCLEISSFSINLHNYFITLFVNAY